MPPTAAETIPLTPRRRLIGTATGGATSLRRGGASDVATTRPYVPGDDVRAIDWKSSARLASVRSADDFIVRERHADEMPDVVVVVDRRPSMALYPDDLPWLHKPAATRAVVELLVRSAHAQRSLVGYLDVGSHAGESDAGTPYWRKPRAPSDAWRRGLLEELPELLDAPFDAPDDSVDLALEFLALRRGSIRTGSLVFVVSDFLAPPPAGRWAHAAALGWEVVPVVVQDPVWEQSFPAIDGVLVTVVDAQAGTPRRVRLDSGEVEARRRANEARLAALHHSFEEAGLEPIVVGDGDSTRVYGAFVEWAHARLELARVVRR
jgi:Protein of unknown function DUF58